MRSSRRAGSWRSAPVPGGRWAALGAAVLALLLAVVLVLTGVGAWHRLHRTPLEEAVRHLPADAQRVSFTDWAQVRQAVRATGLDAGSPGRAVAAMTDRAYDRDLDAASSIDDSAAALQDKYGFSPGTADWEAFSQSKQGAAMLLHLPDGDFDAYARRLHRLGYRRPATDGGVWAGGVDLVARIDPTISPELQYVVLLPGQHLVVSSDTSPYAAHAAAAARGDGPTLAGADGKADVAAQVGGTVAATMWTGDFACADLSMAKADQSAQRQADDLIARAGGINPLTGLVMSMDAHRTLTVAMGFEDHDQAVANLRPRARLAVGPAVGRGEDDFSTDFRLTGSRAHDDTVLLTLRPRTPDQFVLSALYDGPVIFASC